jgi:hypothetical protein
LMLLATKVSKVRSSPYSRNKTPNKIWKWRMGPEFTSDVLFVFCFCHWLQCWFWMRWISCQKMHNTLCAGQWRNIVLHVAWSCVVIVPQRL